MFNIPRLQELIKNLNTGEKRRISVSLKSSKEKSLQFKLYQYLAQKEQLSQRNLNHIDKLLSEAVRPDHVINNLSKTILAVLTGLELNTVRAEITQLLLQQEIVYQKGLFDLALDMVCKAKKLAFTHELFVLYKDALDVEFYYRQKHWGTEEANKIKDLSKEKKQIKQIHSEIEDLEDIQSTLYLCIRGSYVQDTNHEILEIAQHPILNQTAFLSVRAEFLHFICKLMIAQIKNNQDDCFEITQNLVQLIEDNPNYVKGNPARSFAAYGHLLNAQYGKDLLEEAEEIFSKINIISLKSPFLNAYRFEQITHKELAFLNKKLLKSEDDLLVIEAKTRADEIAVLLPKYAKNITPLFYLLTSANLGITYFLVREYDLAIEYLQNQINKHPRKLRTDLLFVTQLVYLCIICEKGDMKQLKITLPSFQKKLEYADFLGTHEKAILCFLKNYSKKKGLKERQVLINELQQKLNTPLPKGKKDSLNRLFDFGLWVERLKV